MKYLVDFSVVDFYEIEVEAESADEAKQQVIDRWNAGEELLDLSRLYSEGFGEVTNVF